MRTCLLLIGVIATAAAHPGHQLMSQGTEHATSHILAWVGAGLCLAAVAVAAALLVRSSRRRQAHARA